MNLYFRLLLLRLRARRLPRLRVWDTARTRFRVTLGDLDILMHMNNGRYLTILDIARLDLLTRSGFWARIKARGWYPVVAGQTISYRRSLTLGQRFDVHTRLLGIDDRWVYVEQIFAVGSTVYAHAVVRARFLRKEGGSVDHDELLALTGPPPADLVLPEWVAQWSAASRPPSEYPAGRAG